MQLSSQLGHFLFLQRSERATRPLVPLSVQRNLNDERGGGGGGSSGASALSHPQSGSSPRSGGARFKLLGSFSPSLIRDDE